jgi:uncharacterized sulfatase
MKRRTFLQGAIAGAATAALSSDRARAADSRPNILWITCEDISAHIGCYGDAEATTPNLDALAAQGARYDNAYSICGVCAPSRSCLITGMYTPSIGTHHMRCRNTPPPHVRCFPEYLQEAGYYCTNNSKTDYNFEPPKTAWNESSRKAHWRNRPDKDQPFFSVMNFTVTHESRVGTLPKGMREGEQELLTEGRHDPANAQLPPYYADTPVIRKHWAHYYDLITAMDRQVGEVLQQLEDDGLADNTIVMWYSDHGVGMPRAKRWLYDSGMHVPMIVRWPGAIEPGSVRDELVSFVDFAPTVLSLAGVTPPDHMQGQIILGDDKPPAREYVYGMRDRMDERYDHIRAVRDKQYKYIRNYEPYRPYDQYLKYPENFPVMQEMRRVQAAGVLNEVQQLFFRQEKPLEELYDTDADPHELNNLAADAEQADRLQRLRDAMDTWELEIRDLGAIPEFALRDWLAGDEEHPGVPNEGSYAVVGGVPRFGRTTDDWAMALLSDDRRRRLAAAKAFGVRGNMIPLDNEPDPLFVYWACVSIAHARSSPSETTWEQLRGWLESNEVAHQLGAAWVYVLHGRGEEALSAIGELMAHENEYTRLHATQLLERIASSSAGARALLETASEEDTNNYVKQTAQHAMNL